MGERIGRATGSLPALRAAAARAEITPEVGTELSGWCFGASRGVHDALYARALVLRARDSAPLVLISLDLIGLDTGWATEVRSEIAVLVGAGAERVILACSHTHSGPSTMPLRRWGTLDRAYLATLRATLVTLVRSLAGREEDVHLAWYTAAAPGVAVNRRGAGGEVDHAVRVVRVERASGGRPIAVIWNYACHPVVGHGDRNLISADLPGVVARDLEPETVALFLLGAAGDVNPVAFHDLALLDRYAPTLVAAARGGGVGEAVVEDRAVGTSVSLAATSEAASLAVAPLPAVDVLEREVATWTAEAARLADDPVMFAKREDALIKVGWAAEALTVVRGGTAATSITYEITAWRIGPITIIATQPEIFAETGRRIREAVLEIATDPSGHESASLTMVATLANGSLCYVPTRAEHRRGGYEVDFSAKVYGLYHVTEDAADGVVAAAVRAAARVLRVPAKRTSHSPESEGAQS